MKVLVIEDWRRLIESLSVGLKRLGYTVVTFRDGETKATSFSDSFPPTS